MNNRGQTVVEYMLSIWVLWVILSTVAQCVTAQDVRDIVDSATAYLVFLKME